MKRKRWIWIGGWGLPPAWLREKLEARLPEWDHFVIPPVRNWEALFRAANADRCGGYSLGARLLLHQSDAVTAANRASFPVLLAPFLPPEPDSGERGRRHETGFRKIQDLLSPNPAKALALFCKVAGLHGAASAHPPYPLEELAWGLRFLQQPPSPVEIPPHWSVWLGENDPLIDTPAFTARHPSVNTVPGAGHDAGTLLDAFVTEAGSPEQS